MNEGDDPQNQTSLKDIERLTILEEEHQMWIPGGEHYNRMSKVVDDFLEKQASEGK